MKFAITILRAWRFRHRTKGAQELPPGVYYVPDQLEERYALLAIDQGMARRMSPPATVPAVAAAVAPPPPIEPPAVDPPTAPEPPRKRGRRRKGAAPENKLFDVAANK